MALIIIKPRKFVISLLGTFTLGILLSGALVWAYNIGSVTFTDSNAAHYISKHCEKLSNGTNSWYECKNDGINYDNK